MKFASAVLALCAGVQAKEEYTRIVPNAGRVVVDGVVAFALGHPDLRSRETDEEEANPFGRDLQDAVEDGGSDAEIWAAICDLDSDDDGLTNGEELCDPDCTHAGKNVDCVGGAKLTHPGFAEGTDVPLGSLPGALVIHGLLMFFAWAILAPFGVIRAVFYKKRGGKPLWFRDHKYALYGAVACTWLGFLIVAATQGMYTVRVAFEFASTGEAKDFPYRLHAIFGIFVLILSVVQPISGYFRAHLPEKGEAKSFNRLAWEFQHQWTGRITLLLAVCALVSGIRALFAGEGFEKGFGVFVGVVLALIGAICVVYVAFLRDSHLARIKEQAQSLEAPKDDHQHVEAAEPMEGNKRVASGDGMKF